MKNSRVNEESIFYFFFGESTGERNPEGPIIFQIKKAFSTIPDSVQHSRTLDNTTVAFISSIGQSAHKCFAARRLVSVWTMSPGPLLSARPARGQQPQLGQQVQLFSEFALATNDAICTILRVRQFRPLALYV